MARAMLRSDNTVKWNSGHFDILEMNGLLLDAPSAVYQQCAPETFI